MKILFVTHRMPWPPTDGARVRAYHCLAHLYAQGHQISVASMARDTEEMANADKMIGLCCDDHIVEPVNPFIQKLRMVSRLLSLTPSSMGYFFSRRLRQRIREAAQPGRFDLIFVHCSSVADYVADIHHTPKFMDFVDMDSHKWLDYAGFMGLPKSPGYWLEGRKLARAEARLARQFDLNTVVTPGELETLNNLAPERDNQWFSNGVDLSAFQPDNRPPDAQTLVFTGRMDYYPNIEAMLRFSSDVMPLLLAQRPNLQLLIVGAKPSAEIRHLNQHDNIEVTGFVDQVQPYIRRATISIAPLNIARGLQNKILEAMAMGVPVIASSLSARGVDATPGEHLLTADSAAQWRDQILLLLDAPERRAELIAAGRQRVTSKHNWPVIMATLDQLIARCISNHATHNNKKHRS